MTGFVSNPKTYGELTLYRNAEGRENARIGPPDPERDAAARLWGWSVFHTQLVAKTDYDALFQQFQAVRAECDALKAMATDKKPNPQSGADAQSERIN